MRDKITYEWDLEESDEYGDVTDHNHAESINDLPSIPGEIVLIRDSGNDDDGLTDRAWAYVANGELPIHFTDANGSEVAKVPSRFRNELRKYLANRSLEFASA